MTTILGLFLVLQFYGQDTTIFHKIKYEYCELVMYQKDFSAKFKVIIDIGEGTTDGRIIQKNTIKNEKGKNFNSMIEALNYKAKDGWEFVYSYEVMGDVMVDVGKIKYHWLLKRPKNNIFKNF